ncbi:hypothetical protein HPULCUR_002452 [Helicostylum pulchrum]|uniref:Uncharacterized protein n=1 Tax=Helicostylum pulchrum TaxID=562976 RepID=A0ABP9XRM5_9FUNG
MKKLTVWFRPSVVLDNTPKTTAAVTKTTSTVKSTPTNESLVNKIVLTEREKDKKFENKYHRNSDDEDNDDDKYKNNQENSKNDHDDDDDDDDDDNSQSSSSKDDKHESKDNDHSKPSNTVVTTIIIVSTEVPTSIYTGNNNPAKQKGTGDQINDPNSNTRKGEMPSETEIVDELIKGRNAYHQLVLALSIVGGIAGIALLTGTFIFFRMRIRKRKRKEDLEMAQSSSPSPPSSPLLTFPSPTHQPRSRPPSLNPDSSRAMSEDDNMTVLNIDSDPFMDPPTTPTNLKLNQMFMNRSSLLPSAPPTTPTRLEPDGYIDYRQNQTLSMLSQTTSTAAPSAPSAKEFNAIPKHENPFEDEYGSDHLDQQPSITRENIRIREYHTPIPSQRIPPSQRVSLSQSTDSFSSDLPPPAYTPCAPSAPPLYALPTNIRSIEPLQHEEDSSRRHSISSCSVISSIRPLSLRRGSGSLAHISSPFS